MANSVKLNFDPGSRSDGSTYSNAGYNLLGRIVEQVSGLSYERYVRIHLLGKVPMLDAAFDTTAYTGATWAHGVEVDGDTRAIQRFNLYGEEDPKHPIINGKPLSLRERRPHIAHEQNPCGGLWTSAADLSSWMAHLQCIAEDTLVAPTAPVLQRNTLLEMWRTQRSIPGKRTAIGLGWWNYDDPEQGRYVFHVGNDPGYSSILLMWPEFGVGVVILCNGMYADDGVWNVLGPGVARIVMGL
jgi:CubicO group peptidase (beta-lactamase class C family)